EPDVVLGEAVLAAGEWLSEAGLLIGNVLRDAAQVRRRRHAVLGKAAPDLPAGQVLAVVEDASPAIVAPPADHPPVRHHPVTDREPLRSFAQRHHVARPLVPHAAGILTGLPLA